MGNFFIRVARGIIVGNTSYKSVGARLECGGQASTLLETDQTLYFG